MDKERLISIIENFRGKRIAVVGDVMLDNFLHGSTRLSPENDGVLVVKVKKDDYRLGGAANTAANLVGLEAGVFLFGSIGKDMHGEKIREICEEKGVNTKLFSCLGQTIYKARVSSEGGHQFVRVDRGEAEGQLCCPSEEVAEEVVKSLDGVDAILIVDYNKGVFWDGLAEKIIRFANQKGIPTVVDFKPVNWNKFKDAEVVCPNFKEAVETLGLKEEEIQREEVSVALSEKMNCKISAVTCGPHGISLAERDSGVSLIPTRAREVFDVTGAGDTVSALFGLSLAAGADYREAAEIANHAAGIVVGKVGTATVTKEELIEAIGRDK